MTMPDEIWAIRGPREEWGHHIGGHWDEISSEDTKYIRADRHAEVLKEVINRMDYARRGGKVHPEEWQQDITALENLLSPQEG